jgi:hypothetical protein
MPFDCRGCEWSISIPNFLILALVPGTAQDQRLRAWLSSGENVNLSTIAWTEFFCGPVGADVLRAASMLFPLPEPYNSTDAARAADLFISPDADVEARSIA